MLAKISIEELELALAHIKKNSNDLSVSIGQDDSGRRIIIKANDRYNKEIKITVYDADVKMFPEVNGVAS